MCICFYTLAHPSYSLVLATNRDEFLSRPTQAAHWHRAPTSRNGQLSADGTASILSGIDSLGGGTWFGIEGTTGKFGLLTNVREEASVRSRSRGRLVSDWLESQSTVSLQDHIDELRQDMHHYAGFNLLVGQIDKQDAQIRLAFLSNRSEQSRMASANGQESEEDVVNDLKTATQQTSEPDPGGVMSNGALVLANAPAALQEAVHNAWPKMDIGKQAFQAVVAEHGDEKGPSSQSKLIERLLDVLCLSHPNVRNAEDVRSSVLVTPFDLSHALPPALQAPVSSNNSPHIQRQPAWYATRAQTVLLVEQGSGRVTFVERQAYELDKKGGVVWSGEQKSWRFVVGDTVEGT